MASLGAGRGRVIRLLQLVLALKADRCPNARELAEVCEVSRRTVYRDLEVLGMAGVPVRYRPDRQGYELAPGFSFTPPALDEAEAAALLVLARQWGGPDGLGLARAARSGARKLLQALPAEVRGRVQGLVELAGPEGDPPDAPPERRAVYDTLGRALAGRRQVRIRYLDEDGVATGATKVSPYRLAFARSLWWLVGRSSHHCGVRSFPVARILRAELTDDPYTIPPRFEVGRLLSFGTPPGTGSGPTEVRLRFSGRVAPEVVEACGTGLGAVEGQADGGAIVRFGAEGLDEVLRWVVGFGDQVEVLTPPELRRRLAEIAGAVARVHAATPRSGGGVGG